MSIIKTGVFYLENKKLFCTELQAGWRWNESKMMWNTVEDFVDTNIVINPRLVKYSAKEFITNAPEQFKRINLNHINDCKMVNSVCKEPIRIFSLNNKLGTVNKWGHKRDPEDHKCTPFHLMEIDDCRTSMLSLTDASFNNGENEVIRQDKHDHLRSVINDT